MTQFKQFGIKPIPHIESVFDGGENIYKLLCFSFDMDKLKQAKEELKHHKNWRKPLQENILSKSCRPRQEKDAR